LPGFITLLSEFERSDSGARDLFPCDPAVYETARAEAVRVGSYEESMTKAASYRRKAKRQRKKEKVKS